MGHTNTNTATQKPKKISGLSDVVYVGTGYFTSYAIHGDGTVSSWGLNTNGQLGHGDSTNRSTPTKISNLSNVKQIVGGDYFTVAVLNDGSIRTC